jgi:hypothetical protein
MNKKVYSLLLLASLLCGSSLQAQTKPSATRPLPLLELSADARTAALGGNHYGESDIAHIYANPTSRLYQDGLLSISAGGQFLGKVEGLEGSLGLYDVMAGVRLGNQAFFGGVRYLGGLKYYPVGNNEEAGKKARSLTDYALDLGYALRFGTLSAYVTGSYISTDQGSAASAYAFGGGVFYRSSEEIAKTGIDFIVGAKFRNLGPSFQQRTGGPSIFPPASAGVGGEIGYGIEGEHHLSFGLGADYFFLPSDASSVLMHFGGEYLYHQLIAARLGYSYDTNGAKAFSVGLGLRYRQFALDGAYITPRVSGGKSAFQLTLGYSL